MSTNVTCFDRHNPFLSFKGGAIEDTGFSGKKSKFRDEPFSSTKDSGSNALPSEDIRTGVKISAAFRKDTAFTQNSWITRFQLELARFGQLREGWDSYDSPPPEAEVINMASTFLDFLWRKRGNSLKPSRIAPSVDSGIAISFLRDNVRANIEFFESGEIVAAITKTGLPPRVWEIKNGEHDLERAISEISNEIKN